MQERMEFLKADLVHLFDDQGIDKSQYDHVVKFRDPITAYNNAKGYMFNIALLKRVFSPKFFLHDIRQTGEHEATTRWTMVMDFTLLPQGSALRKFWSPKLTFTGVSIMGVNPENGKFNRHIDYWDAIANQEYFSLEALQHVLAQLASLSHAPPGLETPPHMVLRKRKDYEVRRYEPFLVAEAALGGADPAGDGGDAFRTLAGYLFGENAAGERMAMTAPVISSTSGVMQFFMGGGRQAADVPAPTAGSVRVREMSGGLFAIAAFSGHADPPRARAEAEKLRAALARDGMAFAGDDWALLRYNDPGTWPPLRLNEVLVPLAGFDLWG
ncbi:hypothetical protein WJX81_000491 [Elliptochloris bilobata]|uniref:SOUL heme-binding protein n=1 Tax=Elliptochloris bilobata TaxID=381761 RepID=A0AAW1QMU5_9CHLO